MSAIFFFSWEKLMPVTPPGETRRKILRFVRERLLAGEPPTVREVQAAFGFRAVQTAHKHLEQLAAEGLLTKNSGRSRGYRLAEDGAVFPIPLLGFVQAGGLTSAIENPEGYIPASAPRVGEELFALRVRGESMRDAGILPGDIAVVRRQESATHGDIVVALVEDEATVKRFHLRRGLVELHPANDSFAPIVVSADKSFAILGKVIEIRRNLEEIAKKQKYS
jgi:repressor LexA